MNQTLFDSGIPTVSDLSTVIQLLEVEEPAISQLFKQIALAYSSEGRFYHTLAHVGQLLGVVKFLLSSGDCHLTRDRHLALRLAAWFHDVIYDPRRDDNEAQSVAWMEHELLPLNISKDVLLEATILILATRSHVASSTNFPAQIFLDADLSILGAPPQVYARYKADIRREYAFVADDAYRAGRRAVLERFLARPQIFNHPIAVATLEKQARANVIEEIHTLSTGF